MTEEILDVQPKGEGDAQEAPLPTISSSSADVSSEAPQFDAEALVDEMLEKLAPMLDNKIDARFKSAKDKRFAKVEEILSAVKEAGGDPEKVRGRLEQADLYDRLDKIEAGIRSGGDVGASPEPDIQGDTTEILQKADIPFDDPDVAEWAGKSFTSETQAITALKALVTKRAKQESGVSQATAVGASSQPAPPGESDDELLERIEKLLKHPLQNIEERKKLIAEAKKRELMK